MKELKFDNRITAELKQRRIDAYMKRITEGGSYDRALDFRGKTGVFKILGADQSGSYSHSVVPEIALLTGKFEDVLNVAVQLDDFCYWSDTGGGSIKLVEITDAAQVKTPF